MGNADQTNDRDKLKLYLRFPHKIGGEENVRKLHPKIKRIFLPRQQRWCIVCFSTSDVAKSAYKTLRRVKLGGKKLIVTPHWTTHPNCLARRLLRAAKRRGLRKEQREEIAKQVVRKAPRLAKKIAKVESKPSVISTDYLVDLLKKEEKP